MSAGTWDVLGNYGQGWEVVTAAGTWREARDLLRDYRDNERGVPFRARRVPAPRLKYGDRTACATCGMDVQWCGRPFRRTLIPAGDGRPAVTMPDGGWVGRGGDRFCDQSGAFPRDDYGIVGTFPHRLHRSTR